VSRVVTQWPAAVRWMTAQPRRRGQGLQESRRRERWQEHAEMCVLIIVTPFSDPALRAVGH